MSTFPWESKAPIFDCDGFLAAKGLLVIKVGYADFGGPVLLYAIECISDTRRIWRKRWTHREVAARDAEDLVADIEEYLDQINAVQRPSEDLDLDDFIQHITERYNHGLH